MTFRHALIRSGQPSGDGRPLHYESLAVFAFRDGERGAEARMGVGLHDEEGDEQIEGNRRRGRPPTT